MEEKNVEIRLVTKWPAEDIVALYKAGGWWKNSDDAPHIIAPLIRGSLAFAVAIDISSGRGIGMGRLLSDRVSDAYIQDVIVLPDYRGYGIGKRIVTTLITFCITHGITWISLISEPGQEKFYEKIGFKKMKNHSPMKYQLGK